MLRTVLVALLLTASCRLYHEPTFFPPSEGFAQWQTVPVGVTADPDLTDTQLQALDYAVVAVNRSVGCVVLSRQAEGGAIRVRLGDPTLAAGAFSRTLPQPSPSYHVTITLYVVGDATQDYLSFVHELGHALGLAHDPRELRYSEPDPLGHDQNRWGNHPSVMIPNVVDFADDIPHLPELSDADAAALRERYCR